MSKRLLLVSDGAFPLTTTGFGYVSGGLLPSLLELGDVYHFALGGVTCDQIIKTVSTSSSLNRLAEVFPTSRQDLSGSQIGGLADIAYAVSRPDVIVIQADLGQVCTQVQHIVRLFGSGHPPIVAYSPVEGEPLMPGWRSMMKNPSGSKTNIELQGIVTVSAYGQRVIESETERVVPWVSYGIDHEYFRPPTPDERAQARRSLGWSDKFVVMDVATNVARKEHPRLFQTIKCALPTIKNILFYDHTKPFQGFWLGGHHLPTIAADMKIADHVEFHDELVSDKTSHYQGVRTSFRERYWAADVFLHLAEVEGFGLPLAEAMSCGLPIVTVPYAAGWETVGEKGGAALGCDIADWTYNLSGTRVAHVSPSSAAQQLVKLWNKPKLREELGQRGVEISRKYTISKMSEVVTNEIRRWC